MKSTILLLALSAILPVPALGLSLSKRNDGSPRVLSLNLHRRAVRNPVANDAKRLRKRAGSVNATVDNHVGHLCSPTAAP